MEIKLTKECQEKLCQLHHIIMDMGFVQPKEDMKTSVIDVTALGEIGKTHFLQSEIVISFYVANDMLSIK